MSQLELQELQRKRRPSFQPVSVMARDSLSRSKGNDPEAQPLSPQAETSDYARHPIDNNRRQSHFNRRPNDNNHASEYNRRSSDSLRHTMHDPLTLRENVDMNQGEMVTSHGMDQGELVTSHGMDQGEMARDPNVYGNERGHYVYGKGNSHMYQSDNRGRMDNTRDYLAHDGENEYQPMSPSVLVEQFPSRLERHNTRVKFPQGRTFNASNPNFKRQLPRNNTSHLADSHTLQLTQSFYDALDPTSPEVIEAKNNERYSLLRELVYGFIQTKELANYTTIRDLYRSIKSKKRYNLFI